MTGNQTSGGLDYRWWASNAPTGGYLSRLALDAVCQSSGKSANDARSVELHVLRLAAAGPVQIHVTTTEGAAGLATSTALFVQDGPVATATVHFVPPRGVAVWQDIEAPAALPAQAYPEMSLTGGSYPPVMCQFSHRPVVALAGIEARPDWDVVWLSPKTQPWSGRADALNVLDCWYPPAYQQAARTFIQSPRAELVEPPQTNLIAVQALFPASPPAYEDLDFVLLANRLTASADGHLFEHSEVWSQQGHLLIQAQIVRRNEDKPTDHN